MPEGLEVFAETAWVVGLVEWVVWFVWVEVSSFGSIDEIEGFGIMSMVFPSSAMVSVFCPTPMKGIVAICCSLLNFMVFLYTM